MADIEKDETLAAADEVAAPAETEAAAESSVTEAVPASDKKQKKKNRKPNIFARLGRRIAKFWRDYNSERKKISWKPWRDVCKSALIVVVTVIIFSAIIYGMDELFKLFFGWLRTLVATLRG